MENLSTSDIAQLYSTEKRNLITRMTDAAAVTSRVLRQGGASEEIIDMWEEQSQNTMYYCIGKLRKKYYGDNNANHSWIGIDPSGLTIQQLHDRTLELLGKYCFVKEDDVAFCVEQNTKNGKRPHIHMMIRGVINQRPAYIAKRLAEHYGCAPNFIDVKHFRKNKLYSEHLNYIKGIKEESKMPYVQLDKQDRETLGIPHFKLFS